MQLMCRSNSGRVSSIDYNETTNVEDVKEKLTSFVNLQKELFSLFFHATLLQNTQKIIELNIKQHEFISIYLLPQAYALRNAQKTAKKKITKKSTTRSLPPRNDSYVPKNIERLVQKLESMGFEHDKCRQALIASSYNIDRAANYLIEDNIPEIQDFDLQAEQKNIAKIVESNPYRSSNTPNIQLSADDVNALRSFASEGFDMNLAIQTYVACDCDQATTRNCLLTLA